MAPSFLNRALRRSVKPAIRTAQVLATLHLLCESVGEVLPCAGFSMLPTLSHDGDVVLVSSMAYWRPRWMGGGERIRPQRGDVVVASSPLDPRQTVCKRVLGIEGDVVEVEPRRGSRAWSVAAAALGDVGDSPEDRLSRPGEARYVKIPRGYVWLAGDNLSNSTDSRLYGPVPLAMVRSKVIARVGDSGFGPIQGAPQRVQADQC